MPIRDWPEGERPREKLLQRGATALSDAELLAIFLRTGVAGRSAVDLARDLLLRFGSLRALIKAPQADFCAAHGLGNAKYAQLQAMMEISRRHLAEGLGERQALHDPQAARPACATSITRPSSACSWTASIACSPATCSPAARSTAPASTRARW